ncbi:MAG: hypothetical protein ACJ8J3_24580 [Burkholderia ambifaria]
MQTVSRLASGGREPGAGVTAGSASATRRDVRAEPSARRRTEL